MMINNGKKITIPTLDTVKAYRKPKLGDLIVPEKGIYYDTPFEEYLKWDCFSKSAIKSLRTSPAHYWDYRNTPLDTKAIREGRLLDCMLLEPELFYKQFVIPPDHYFDYEKKPTKKEPNPRKVKKDWSPYTSFCKNWKAGVEKLGLTVVKEEDVQKAINCMSVIGSKPTIKQMFEGKKQVSIVWDDPMTGVRCKARFDILADESINDLKKTKDASSSDTGAAGFKGEIETYNYDAQAALYTDGWEVLTGEMKPFNFIAVEFFAPFECAAYSIRDQSIINGRIKYREAMEVYSRIRHDEIYDGYPDEIEGIDVPMYKMRKIEDIPEDKINFLTEL